MLKDEAKARIDEGSSGHQRSFDQHSVEELIADHLGVDAALESREAFATKLDDVATVIAGGGFRAPKIYDPVEYQRAGIGYVDRLRDSYCGIRSNLHDDDADEEDVDPFNDIDGLIPADIDNDDTPRDLKN